MEFILLAWVKQSVFLVLKQLIRTVKCFHSIIVVKGLLWNTTKMSRRSCNAIVYGENWTISVRGGSESLTSHELVSKSQAKEWWKREMKDWIHEWTWVAVTVEFCLKNSAQPVCNVRLGQWLPISLFFLFWLLTQDQPKETKYSLQNKSHRMPCF